MYSSWSLSGALGGNTVVVVGKGVIKRSAKLLIHSRQDQLGNKVMVGGDFLSHLLFSVDVYGEQGRLDSSV